MLSDPAVPTPGIPSSEVLCGLRVRTFPVALLQRCGHVVVRCDLRSPIRWDATWLCTGSGGITYWPGEVSPVVIEQKKQIREQQAQTRVVRWGWFLPSGHGAVPGGAVGWLSQLGSRGSAAASAEHPAARSVGVPGPHRPCAEGEMPWCGLRPCPLLSSFPQLC